MSDGTTDQNPESLFEGFSFSPDWAKTSADDHSARLGRMASQFESEGERTDRRRFDRRDRRDGDDRGWRKPPRDRGEGFRGGRDGEGFRGGRDGEGFRGGRERFERGDGFRGGPARDAAGGAPAPRREWRERPPREERRPWVPPPYEVRFIPDQTALNLVARKILSSHKAMSLREITAIFFANPDSTLVRLEWDEAHKDSKFHQCRECEWFSQDEDSLRRHLLSAHFHEWFEPREIDVPPPSGTFTSVAKCGVTGKLLAPPNHHSFNRRVLEMLATPECAGLTEAEYRARIERVTDPEAIEQWRAEASKQTVWVFKDKNAKPKKPAASEPAPKTDEAPPPAESAAPSAEDSPSGEAPAPEEATAPAEAPAEATPASAEASAEAAPEEAPAEAAPSSEETSAEAAPEEAPAPERTYTRDEAEAMFFEKVAPGLARHSRQATASRAASKSIGDAALIGAIRHAWEHEQRIPVSSLYFAIRGGLKARHLAVFRSAAHHREEFVAPRMPTPLVAASAVPELREILEWVSANEGSTKAALLAALLPEGSDPARVSAVQKQLAFLLDRGHLIEFTSGKLALPQVRNDASPKKEEDAKKEEESKKEEEAK